MKDIIEVRSITRTQDGRVSVGVCVENDFGRERCEFVLLDELFCELGIQKGEIDKALLCEMENFSQVTAAYCSACSSFAYSQSSLRALFRKILQKGFSREVCEAAIHIVRSRGFVDEEQIASRRAELMLDKLWGKSRIIMKLREEGFPDSAIKAAMDGVCEIDFAENCARLILKKYRGLPEERHQKQKMYVALARYGYSGSDIKEAVRVLSERYEN